MQSGTAKNKTVEELSGASSPEFFYFPSELFAVGFSQTNAPVVGR